MQKHRCNAQKVRGLHFRNYLKGKEKITTSHGINKK